MKFSFHKFIRSFRSKATLPSSTPSNSHISIEEPVTFKELWNDFDRRSSEYTHCRIPDNSSSSRLANWVGSISYSGHTRERCIIHLIENFQHDDENRILLRLMDWVAQIRIHAERWILENFSKLPIASILSNQRMIHHISGKESLKESPALAEIHRDLVSRATAMSREEFAKFQTTFRRIILAASIHSGHPLRDLLLADKDPTNRLLIFTLPADMPLSEEETDLLADDKSVRVRKAFFLKELESKHILPLETLTRLALDPSRSLRSIGQFHLRKNHGMDAHELYKTFTDDRFYFIADYAKREDYPHFFHGIYLGSGKVRIACLRALSICDPTAIASLDLKPLIAANSKQRQIITKCLPKILTTEEILTFRETFEAASPGGIFTFLRILERNSFWHFVDQALDYIVANAEDPRFGSIRRKMNRTEIPRRPSSTLRDSISEKVDLIEIRFPILASNLRFSLKNA